MSGLSWLMLDIGSWKWEFRPREASRQVQLVMSNVG